MRWYLSTLSEYDRYHNMYHGGLNSNKTRVKLLKQDALYNVYSDYAYYTVIVEPNVTIRIYKNV